MSENLRLKGSEINTGERLLIEAAQKDPGRFGEMDTLPADQRRVIVMRFAEEKSIREIAHELRRTEGAVKQLQFRGLQNLRDRMGRGNG